MDKTKFNKYSRVFPPNKNPEYYVKYARRLEKAGEPTDVMGSFLEKAMESFPNNVLLLRETLRYVERSGDEAQDPDTKETFYNHANRLYLSALEKDESKLSPKEKLELLELHHDAARFYSSFEGVDEQQVENIFYLAIENNFEHVEKMLFAEKPIKVKDARDEQTRMAAETLRLLGLFYKDQEGSIDNAFGLFQHLNKVFPFDQARIGSPSIQKELLAIKEIYQPSSDSDENEDLMNVRIRILSNLDGTTVPKEDAQHLTL